MSKPSKEMLKIFKETLIKMYNLENKLRLEIDWTNQMIKKYEKDYEVLIKAPDGKLEKPDTTRWRYFDEIDASMREIQLIEKCMKYTKASPDPPKLNGRLK